MKKNKITNSKKGKKGETILEVLIALVVITIGSATSTSLIITSIKASEFNRDSLIALNLAQEGIEFMHNLRDTNWIKFSANTQGCWNMNQGYATCSNSNLIKEATTSSGYTLGNAGINEVASALDLSDGISVTEEEYRLKYFDLDYAVNSDGLDKNDSGSFAKERDDYDYIGSNNGAETAVDNTKFYRSISVDYKTIADTSPWAITDVGDQITANLMLVTTTVQWKDGNITHQIKLTSALSKYK